MHQGPETTAINLIAAGLIGLVTFGCGNKTTQFAVPSLSVASFAPSLKSALVFKRSPDENWKLPGFGIRHNFSGEHISEQVGVEIPIRGYIGASLRWFGWKHAEINRSLKTTDAYVCKKMCIVRGRLTLVSENYIGHDFGLLAPIEADSRKPDISSQLALGTGPRNLYGCFSGANGLIGSIVSSSSGSGGFSRLVNHFSGMVSSAFGMKQGGSDEYYTYKRQRYGGSGCIKHKFCPKGHPFLGFQIVYLVGSGVLALGISFLIYYVAYRGLDLIERGRRFPGGGVFFLTVFSGPVAVGAVLMGGGWLVFESARLLLLGIEPE